MRRNVGQDECQRPASASIGSMRRCSRLLSPASPRGDVAVPVDRGEPRRIARAPARARCVIAALRHCCASSLLRLVIDEFKEYLRCDRLEPGFVRVKRDGCRHEHLAWPAASLLVQVQGQPPIWIDWQSWGAASALLISPASSGCIGFLSAGVDSGVRCSVLSTRNSNNAASITAMTT